MYFGHIRLKHILAKFDVLYGHREKIILLLGSARAQELNAQISKDISVVLNTYSVRDDLTSG